MTVELRPATAADIAACVDLRGRTRENAVSAQRLAAMGITVASWSKDVATGALAGFVCMDGQTLAGYAFGDRVSGEVVVLAVLPQYEGQGLGRRLLQRIVEHLSAAGHERLFLGCSTDPRTRSFGFYRRLGWSSTGTIDRFDDEVLEFYPSIDPGARRTPQTP
jgi:ribosomal protein S18 acetylase RimI-like enzyme